MWSSNYNLRIYANASYDLPLFLKLSLGFLIKINFKGKKGHFNEATKPFSSLVEREKLIDLSIESFCSLLNFKILKKIDRDLGDEKRLFSNCAVYISIIYIYIYILASFITIFTTYKLQGFFFSSSKKSLHQDHWIKPWFFRHWSILRWKPNDYVLSSLLSITKG